MKLTMFDIKESVYSVAVCGTATAMGCFAMALVVSNFSKECQETATWSDISSAALQCGAVNGTTMLLNDIAHRVHGGGVRLQLPGLLNSASYFLGMSTAIMSLYVGAYYAQSEECQDDIWNKMTA